MIQPEPEEKKKVSLLDKLPKLGRASQLMLLVGIFLIVFIPLWVINQQQPAKQVELRHELSLLEIILQTPTTKKDITEAELKKVEAQEESAKAAFPSPDQNCKIINRLLELAESNDLGVTSVAESTSEETVSGDEDATEWPVLTYEIGLDGQIPNFQNFILALDDKFTTCRVEEVVFTVAEEEGEEDTASLKIDVFCYAGSE